MCRLYLIATTASVFIVMEFTVSGCIAFLSSGRKSDYRRYWGLNAVDKGTGVLSSDSALNNRGILVDSVQPPTLRTGDIDYGGRGDSSGSRNVHYKHHHKLRIRTMFRQAKSFERTGQWAEACVILQKILRIDPFDAHSHLAYARIQSRRENRINERHTTTLKGDISLEKPIGRIDSKTILMVDLNSERCNNSETSQARQAFINGTQHCPNSVHLWQAWAMHEEGWGNVDYARGLYQKALNLDPFNPYVCHAYGLMEQRSGNIEYAEQLLRTPIQSSANSSCTAALVCSLGELLINQKRYHDARIVYLDNVQRVSSERQISEVYLAAAWLEEKQFHDFTRAEELLQIALSKSPENSRAQVALARLEGRKIEGRKNQGMFNNNTNSTMKNEESFNGGVAITRNCAIRNRLKNICASIERKHLDQNNITTSSISEVKDGRIFNTWANLEIKCGNYTAARDILAKAMRIFPRDHSIVQAAGNVEQRLGNLSAADEFYSASLSIQPSAPALVAIAMLELRKNNRTETCNMTKVEKLFEEALLLDRRHGPVYNAYGIMELQRGNIEKARGIYTRGLQTRCTASASVYHGLAKLELSQGNLETARSILIEGLKEAEYQDAMMDNHQRDRASFLAHTLGMLELRCNRAAEAKQVFLDGLHRHGGSSQLLLGAALCELKLGNENRARHLFEQAVTADRKHAQAWQCWGVVEMRAGNYQLAKALFEFGIRNDPHHGALWQAYGKKIIVTIRILLILLLCSVDIIASNHYLL